MKKIAIVHDYLKEYGGAERVLEELIKLFPNADVYTSLYAPEFLGPHKERFDDISVKTTFLNSIPFRHRLISPLRLLSPFAFKSLDLHLYDIIIVRQTGAYFPNLVKKGKAKLICYTHTPPRYLYGLTTAREWKKNGLTRVAGHIAFHFLRMVDFSASKNVDTFIANSEEVRTRIEKFYRRNAEVIYPPVKVPSVIKGEKKDYYLFGGRLARSKGVDVVVDAFVKNKKPLKVFGRGFAGYDEHVKSLAAGSSNIEFLGEVSDEKKFELMSGAKAFVFASYDEDFGITPVEAMGTGTPVIAYKSGGVKETVIDGKTGIFYDENSAKCLNEAIAKFESLKLDPNDSIEQAEKFSEKEFDSKIKKLVEL